MSDYKPTGKWPCPFSSMILIANHLLLTEHDGLRKDGQPDQRVNTGQFAQGKVDPVEAGKQGGQTGGQASGDSSGDSSGGSQKGQFAHGKVDPHEAGKKSGSG